MTDPTGQCLRPSPHGQNFTSFLDQRLRESAKAGILRVSLTFLPFLLLLQPPPSLFLPFSPFRILPLSSLRSLGLELSCLGLKQQRLKPRAELPLRSPSPPFDLLLPSSQAHHGRPSRFGNDTSSIWLQTIFLFRQLEQEEGGWRRQRQGEE